MQKKYFDSHAHYDDEKFDGIRDEIIEEVLNNGVKYILNAASDLKSSYNGKKLSVKYPQFYYAAGIHPHECGKITDEKTALLELKSFFESNDNCNEKTKKARAVGEIGLDFYYDTFDRKTQIKWFKDQMLLAYELGFPVIIHDREAHFECMNIVREYRGVKGVFHAFSGSFEMAEELVKMGYYISFGGVITFKNAKKAVDAIKAVPLERLLIETDCPYLAPHPLRGKINRSDYLKYTSAKIAEILGFTEDEIAAVSMKNAIELFGIESEIQKGDII